MRRPVGRAGLPGDVGHGPGQHVQVVRQQRREERQGECDAAGLEAVDRARRRHFQGGLGHGRHIRRVGADAAEGLAVNAGHPAEAVVGAGPVADLCPGQGVAEGPGAEIRVMCDKWNGGWAEWQGHGKNSELGLQGCRVSVSIPGASENQQELRRPARAASCHCFRPGRAGPSAGRPTRPQPRTGEQRGMFGV